MRLLKSISGNAQSHGLTRLLLALCLAITLMPIQLTSQATSAAIEAADLNTSLILPPHSGRGGRHHVLWSDVEESTELRGLDHHHFRSRRLPSRRS